MTLTQEQYELNAVAIFTFFYARFGLAIPAVGILAQFNQESSLDPTAVGDKGTAFGLGQWHGDRCQAMANGIEIDPRTNKNLIDQCRAAWWELLSPERAAFEIIMAAADPYDAGLAGCMWMRPAADERDKRGKEAVSLAQFLQARGIWSGP
jgi:hypothetical protein